MGCQTGGSIVWWSSVRNGAIAEDGEKPSVSTVSSLCPKWWKLKGEVAQVFKERVFKEGPWEEGGDADNVWMKMATLT